MTTRLSLRILQNFLARIQNLVYSIFCLKSCTVINVHVKVFVFTCVQSEFITSWYIVHVLLTVQIFMWSTDIPKYVDLHVCWDWDLQFVLSLKIQFFQSLLLSHVLPFVMYRYMTPHVIVLSKKKLYILCIKISIWDYWN